MDKRRIREDVTAVFKYLYGCHSEGVFKFIYIAPQERTKGYRGKLEGCRFWFKIKVFSSCLK